MRMLRNLSALSGFAIGAMDGAIGRIVDFYFDDQSWTVRHLVVDTGRWLAGRQVLISPLAFNATDWDDSRIVVNLTKSQIESRGYGPPVDMVDKKDAILVRMDLPGERHVHVLLLALAQRRVALPSAPAASPLSRPWRRGQLPEVREAAQVSKLEV